MCIYSRTTIFQLMFIGDFDPTSNKDYLILSCECRSLIIVILHIWDCFSCVFSLLVNMFYEWNIVEHFKNACPFKCCWPLQISFHKNFSKRPWYIGVSSTGPVALVTVCYASMQLEFLPSQNLELGWIVITCLIKCGVKWLNYCQTYMMQPLKFKKG